MCKFIEVDKKPGEWRSAAWRYEKPLLKEGKQRISAKYIKIPNFETDRNARNLHLIRLEPGPDFILKVEGDSDMNFAICMRTLSISFFIYYIS